MSELEALWDYQQAELSLIKLNKDRKTTDAYRKCMKLKKLVQDSRTSIDNLQTDIENKNNKMKELSSRLEELIHRHELEKSDLEIMENDAESTPEELSSARKSIENLQGKINALVKELNSLVRWAENAETKINSAWTKMTKAKQDYDVVRTVCDEESESFKPKIARAKALVSKISKQISPELMKKYVQLKESYPTPVARLVNEECGGCNMVLSSVVLRKVAAGSAIVECEHCGRLLLASETEVEVEAEVNN